MCCFMSGQNSAKALLAIRNANPNAVRRPAAATDDSLSGRQVFERYRNIRSSSGESTLAPNPSEVEQADPIQFTLPNVLNIYADSRSALAESPDAQSPAQLLSGGLLC